MENKKSPRYIRGKYSEGQKEATAKYNAKAYDNITVRIPKGRKIEIQAHAEGRDESLNGFINRAINETIECDNSKSYGTKSQELSQINFVENRYDK